MSDCEQCASLVQSGVDQRSGVLFFRMEFQLEFGIIVHNYLRVKGDISLGAVRCRNVQLYPGE